MPSRACAIAIDADSTVVDWAPNASLLFGWTEDDALGKPLWDTIMPPRFMAGHLRGMKLLQDTGEGPILGRSQDVVLMHKDGHEVKVKLAVSVETMKRGRDHYVAVILLRD